jgi:hypothetical protein
MSFEQIFGSMGRVWDYFFYVCSLHPVFSCIFFIIGFILFMRYVFPFFMSRGVQNV